MTWFGLVIVTTTITAATVLDVGTMRVFSANTPTKIVIHVDPIVMVGAVSRCARW